MTTSVDASSNRPTHPMGSEAGASAHEQAAPMPVEPASVVAVLTQLQAQTGYDLITTTLPPRTLHPMAPISGRR
ncbi:MAG: hypothetical protein KF832_09195 [Caldilineaceae bacterium]|nr:hypothetical protein [Caldilineaceae bacterium]